MYRVELNFAKVTIWKDFALAADALEFYQNARGLTNDCVVIIIFDIQSKRIEPALLAECCMKWKLADKLRR